MLILSRLQFGAGAAGRGQGLDGSQHINGRRAMQQGLQVAADNRDILNQHRSKLHTWRPFFIKLYKNIQIL